MKALVSSIIFVLIVTFSHQISAKTLASADQTKDLADKATELIGQNKVKEGILILKEYWPIPEAEIENMINQTEMQWSMITGRFGNSISVDFIRDEKIADTFIKYLYLQKFENHAIRWTIIFYKPREAWKVNNVKWDDQIKLLFTK